MLPGDGRAMEFLGDGWAGGGQWVVGRRWTMVRQWAMGGRWIFGGKYNKVAVLCIKHSEKTEKDFEQIKK